MVYNMIILYYINLTIKIIDEYDYCNLYYVETSGANTT